MFIARSGYDFHSNAWQRGKWGGSHGGPIKRMTSIYHIFDIPSSDLWRSCLFGDFHCMYDGRDEASAFLCGSRHQ